MVGDLSYQDFSWQFTRKPGSPAPRIRVFTFGSEWDRGPGCEQFDRGDVPVVVSPPATGSSDEPVAFTGTVLPPGTVVIVRTLQPIQRSTARIGATFAAELVEPLVVGGRTIAPQGSRAYLKYLHDREGSLRSRGRTVTYVALDAVHVQGKRVAVRGADSPTGGAVTRGSDVNVPQGTRLRFIAK